MTINIDLDKKYYNEMLKTLQGFKKRIGDLTPVWKEFIPEYQKIIKQNWGTHGTLFGKRWEPYRNKNYEKKKKKLGYGAARNLMLTGKLFNATQGGKGWYQNITKTSLEMGISRHVIPYSAVQQYGYPRQNIAESPYFHPRGAKVNKKIMNRLLNILLKYLNRKK